MSRCGTTAPPICDTADAARSHTLGWGGEIVFTFARRFARHRAARLVEAAAGRAESAAAVPCWA